jgi:hypothetical protein
MSEPTTKQGGNRIVTFVHAPAGVINDITGCISLLLLLSMVRTVISIELRDKTAVLFIDAL